MRNILIFIGALFILGVGCDNLSFFKNEEGEVVVASVAGNVLTQNQLRTALPKTMNVDDSAAFAENYIEKWIKNQLLLEKAEINLDKETQDNINIMIDNYRASLMIYKYQQCLLQQKLDTIVTESQIEDYYKVHAGNFKLDSNVVKAIYVQLPKSLHDSYKVRQWMRAGQEDDIINLEDYCYQNARNFNMGAEWIYFNQLMRIFPRNINNQEPFLKYNRYAEAQDSLYKYYISITEYRLVNDTTPKVFVKDKIKDIILNQRRVKFISDLEKNIYNEAFRQKKINIAK